MASGMVRLDRLPGLCQTSQARVPRDRSDVFPHKVAGNSRRASPRSDSGAVQEGLRPFLKSRVASGCGLLGKLFSLLPERRKGAAGRGLGIWGVREACFCDFAFPGGHCVLIPRFLTISSCSLGAGVGAWGTL